MASFERCPWNEDEMSFDGRILSGIGVMLAVVEAGSFVHAARALGLTQSGVSRAIGRLEARIGIRLFERTGRALRLTDDGRRFHDHVRRHIAGIEEAVNVASEATTVVHGKLRINVEPFFSYSVLAPHIKSFLDQHPGVHVELVARDSLGDLIADGFDIAVRFGEPPDLTIIGRRLLALRILTVASPGYIERNGRPRTPRDMENHQVIHFVDPVTGKPFAWEFRQGKLIEPVNVCGRLTVTDVSTMLNACISGNGIAQVLDLGVSGFLQSGQLVEILEDWSEERFPLYAYYPSRNLPPARVRAFLDFVLALVS
jgi:DNA-binding transcriptional LysR family regulator